MPSSSGGRAAASDDLDVERDLPNDGLRHTLVIWCTDTAALYIELLLVTVMYLLSDEFEVGKMLNIRPSDMQYFLLFVVFLIPASWFEDAFTNNINEMLWGWDATAYMQRQADRFFRRKLAKGIRNF